MFNWLKLVAAPAVDASSGQWLRLEGSGGTPAGQSWLCVRAPTELGGTQTDPNAGQLLPVLKC